MEARPRNCSTEEVTLLLLNAQTTSSHKEISKEELGKHFVHFVEYFRVLSIGKGTEKLELRVFGSYQLM